MLEHRSRSLDGVAMGCWGVTYCGDSAGGRDCADRPAGLSQGVSEHSDLGLCIKENMKNQLQMQLREGRLFWWWCQDLCRRGR